MSAATNEKAADPCKDRAARDAQHDDASVGTPSAAVKQLIAVARGTAGDLGAIKLQQQVTLAEFAQLLRQSQAQPFPLASDEYNALRAASDAGDKASDARFKVVKCAPWFVMAAFSADRRVASNLLKSSAIVGDADQPGTTRETLLAALKATGLAYLVHTSTSHGAGGQARYRVIIPLAKPIPREQYPAAWTWLNAQLPGMLDPGAKDATRLNYLPRIPRGAFGHEVILHDGAPWLDPQSIPTTSAPKPIERDDAPVLTEITPEQLADLKAALEHPAMLEAGGEEGFAVTKVMYPLLSLQAIGYELWLNYCANAADNSEQPDPEWPDATWEKHILSAPPTSDFTSIYKTAGFLGWDNPIKAPQTADPGSFPIIDVPAGAEPAPIIRIIGGSLPENAAHAERLLSPHLYTRASQLVRIGEASELTDHADMKLAAETQVILPVTEEYIRRQLTRIATIQRFDARAKDFVNVDCPKPLAQNIAQQRSWPRLRALRGIARSPFVRADGSICEKPGYDPQSQMVLAPNAHFPVLPPAPTKDDAVAALRLLSAPFAEYPYKDESAVSAFLAHILTEAARPGLKTCPAFFDTSPLASTGKTAMSEWPPIIVHGSKPGTYQWAESEEEMRKTLVAALRSGARSMLFDNIPNGSKVRSPHLCSVLTTDLVQDRILGVSEILTVSNTAVICITGNNITPTGDMARRSLVVRLDGNATPEGLKRRRFTIPDLPQHVSSRRVELLMAALTILRAHKLSGHVGPTPLPSFEQWSRTVRDALLWLGMADPVDTQIDETDDESSSVSAAFEVLGPLLAGREFVAQDILAAVGGLMDIGQSLVGTLQAAGLSDPHNPTKIGYWLRECRDKVAAGYKLEQIKRGSSHKGANRWRFRPLETPPVSADADDMGDIL